MMKQLKTLIRKSFLQLGFDIVRHSDQDPLSALVDLTDEERKTVQAVSPIAMTSIERIAALINAVNYIVRNQVPGDIAECGVWRGGSMVAIAMTLMAKGDTSRQLYLYDTFEGMTPPTVYDKQFDGQPASVLLDRTPRNTGIWCYASLEDVQANLFSTGYPRDKIHFVKGKVEETIPRVTPASLSLLRLDTDWYESTKHELVHLFPVLSRRGILIVDDYGHWQGARRAVDEFFTERQENIYLHRIDYTGRIGVRTGT